LKVLDIQSKPQIGPALDLTSVTHGPVLAMGQQQVGPVLTLDAGVQGMHTHSPNGLVVSMAVALAALTLAVLLPLSQMNQFATDAPAWYETLIAEVKALLGQEEMPAVVEAAVADEVIDATAVSFEPIIGAYCFNYMPNGDNAAAKTFFDEMLWSKLGADWQQKALDRLDVCMPFELQTPEVVSAGGCAKSLCGVEDVKFYINTEGKAAIDMNVNGTCTHVAEEGFTQMHLLCTR
jgi:hypothetical protein